MSISLVKGERINLSKDSPSLKKVRFGLGWKANASGGADFDLDASVFLLEKNPDATKPGRIPTDQHFVFYKNKTSPDGAVVHSGDDLTGGTGAADCEQIIVDLAKIEQRISELSFITTIYEYKKRSQNFRQVKDSYIRLVDDDTGKEVARYSLQDDFKDETAVQFGSLIRDDQGHWIFNAKGDAWADKGLDAFVTIYGGHLD